jgi:hypothetical protein
LPEVICAKVCCWFKHSRASSEDDAVLSTDVLYILATLLVVLLGARLVLPFVYRRGRQVEVRLEQGSTTGEILGLAGLRLRVRSLHSGREHTVALTHVRRR